MALGVEACLLGKAAIWGGEGVYVEMKEGAAVVAITTHPKQNTSREKVKEMSWEYNRNKKRIAEAIKKEVRMKEYYPYPLKARKKGTERRGPSPAVNGSSRIVGSSGEVALRSRVRNQVGQKAKHLLYWA